MNKTARFSRDFILVVMGQIISIFGNQILRYALPLYLLNQTGSPALFGSILAISFVPMLFLFPIGGIIADRVNKRNVMVILDFSMAVLIFLFYLLSGRVDIVPLMAVTMILLYGIQGAYQPAVQASVPLLVNKERLMQGNSIVNLITSLASMIGPVIGGLLYSMVGLTPILYVSVVCFFAAATMELFIRMPFEKAESSTNMFVTAWGDLKESFGFLFKTRPVLWKISVIFASINLFLTSLVLIGLPVLVTQHLGFAPEMANRLYGYAQGIIGGGAVLGGLIAGVLSKKLKLKASPLIIIACACSMLVGGLALQFVRSSIGIYLVLAIGGGILVALSTLLQIQVMTSIQILTPQHLIGKVISCVICICMCTNPLGNFIYGIVFEQIGKLTYFPYYGAGVLMIGVGIFSRRIFSGVDQMVAGK
ncbi:MFS transporter [Clostridia bacterium]|nr:MFS transporter [Clostridia bacterium]